jgi:hypothetical protein
MNAKGDIIKNAQHYSRSDIGPLSEPWSWIMNPNRTRLLRLVFNPRAAR